MSLKYFEDLAVGQVIELGTSAEITEEEIIDFARQWDPQPFHIDPEAAKDSLFKGLIASGWHTGAILMRLLVDGLLSHYHSEGSPGLERIRFLMPVRPGDRLTARYTVLEAAPSASRPQIGKVRAKSELINQRGEVTVSVESWGFFTRRPESATS